MVKYEQEKEVCQRGCYPGGITKALSYPMCQWHYSDSFCGGMRLSRPSPFCFFNSVCLISGNWTNHTHGKKKQKTNENCALSCIQKACTLEAAWAVIAHSFSHSWSPCVSVNTGISPHQAWFWCLKIHIYFVQHGPQMDASPIAQP